MYSNILVPTDGSGSAAGAMAEALDLAEQSGATVHVLHVIDSRFYDTSIDSAVEPLRNEGEEYVEDLAAMAEDAGVDVTTAVEVGRPARRILEYVSDNDVGLVVMGTRGRSELSRRLLGSVTKYVVPHADVPVHVVASVDE